MSNPNIPSDNYPFSTIDGKVIPLDIIRPKSLIFQEFVTESATDITIPLTTKEIATVYASQDCILFLGTSSDTLTVNTEYTEALFIPKGHIVTTTIVNGTIAVLGISSAGTIYIQLIEKWAGLSADSAYLRR